MNDIYITWNDYHKKIEQLAKKVHEDNLKFNQIICIAKGGLRVGDVFSRLFNVPLAILSVESYHGDSNDCLLYTSPSPRDRLLSRMPSSA